MPTAKFLPPAPHSGLTAVDVIHMLSDAGFEPCGAGFDAHAYRKEDRVVKVVCGNPGHRAAVDAFHAHPDVDGFPVIYGDVIDLSDGCFVYEMELLEPANAGPGDGCSASDLENALHDYETWDGNAEWLIDNIGADAMEILSEALPIGIDWIDLHENNRMQRACGQIVALDPFHLGASDDYERSQTIRSTHRAVFA